MAEIDFTGKSAVADRMNMTFDELLDLEVKKILTIKQKLQL